MKIGSLRLNNFLRNKSTKKAFKVAKIEAFYDAHKKSVIPIVNDMDAGDVESIPLDDNILLVNCHFEVRRNISCIAMAVLLQDIDQFFIDGKFILIKEKGEYKLFLSNFSTESSHGIEQKKISYLHELQNVYQLIAGEELNVQM
jgi:hypothetical protein